MEEIKVVDRRIYYVQLAFDNPVEATVTIAATDEDHCRQIIAEQFKDRKGLRVIDICDAVALEKVQMEMEAQKAKSPLIHAEYEDVSTAEQSKPKLTN